MDEKLTYSALAPANVNRVTAELTPIEYVAKIKTIIKAHAVDIDKAVNAELANGWKFRDMRVAVMVGDMRFIAVLERYEKVEYEADSSDAKADWVQRGEEYYCSHCGGTAPMDINRKHTVTTKFCPHCGYKMGE